MKQPKWFQQKLFSWYKVNGRKNLPWQHNINAYRVWVSEIMLQQTQVATVIPYFEKFMRHFPNIFVLTKASLDEVLNFWAGLGYYSRAKNLHRTAQIITEQYQGNFPSLFEELEKLPGIGKSTAGAILAFAYHKRAPILDGNVKRVLVRFHAIQTQLNHSKTLKQLWELSERYTPKKNIEHYTQAIMDLGSLVCTRTKPQCDKCPLHEACLAFLNHLQNQLPIKNNPLKISSKEIKMLMFQMFKKIFKVGVITESVKLEASEIEHLGKKCQKLIDRYFAGSLAIRAVDAGSCNGCELEIHALNNAFYDIERFGVHFVASPRHADVLLVTGPVSKHMEAALKTTYQCTPDPKYVIAMGSCAANGGEFGCSYASSGAVSNVIPVDCVIDGCPPTPLKLLEGILLFISSSRAK